MSLTSLENAIVFHKQGRLDKAEEQYIDAFNDNPEDINALYLLGTLWLQMKKPGIASVLFDKAIALKPDHFEAFNNLGNCHLSSNRHERAKECWKQALRIAGRSDYEYADVWNNLASSHVNAGSPEMGIPLAEKAISLRADQPDAHWNLALMKLELGHYADGWDEYTWGYKTKNRDIRNYTEKVLPWDGSHGKVVIVWGEQGIGDEILFASMIPDLMKISKQVIFDCHPRLVKLFEESFPEIKCYGTRKDAYLHWVHNHPEADSKIAIDDLGRFFRRDLSDFPQRTNYLKANSERIDFYRKKLAKLGDRLKVGISWTGGYKKTRKDYRSIPLNLWDQILKSDADFISLQYTPEALQSIAESEEQTEVKIHHWPLAVQNQDYHETAALVSALDLVITVNTSIHHLAGALGKECWTLTPKAHAWRYWSPDADGHSIPWYPSCYQFMQKNIFDWDGLIGQVSRKLRAKIRERMPVCA